MTIRRKLRRLVGTGLIAFLLACGSVAEPSSCQNAVRTATLSDNELVDLFRAGERNSALTELHARFDRGVRATAYRILNDRLDAEDISQQVWSDVLLNLDKFRGDSTFKTWVERIAHNRSLNLARQRSTRETRHREMGRARSPIAPDGLGLWIDGFDRQLQWSLVPESVATLTEEERGVIELFYLDDLSFGEVAERLQIPVGTVKSRLNRGLEKLRRRVPRLN